ncbi:MAG: isochorismate synthase [Candidatus Sericytochromatia bacterium]
MPVVAYKEAYKEPVLVACSNNNLKKNNIDYNNDKGFIFAPFDVEKNDTFLIPFDFKIENNTLLLLNNDNDILKKYEYYNQEVSLSYKNNFFYQEKLIPNYSKQDFCDLVEKIVTDIKQNNTDKIIASRTLKVKLDDNFDSIELFNKLTKKYTNAFISLVCIPNVGTWIGATPETLLDINNKRINTMAVAGTQKFNSKNKEIYWENKEINEHQYVIDYIKNVFDKYNITYKIEPTTNLIAGSVVHIITKFSGELQNKTNLNNLILDFHPTPAVCGLSKNKAMDFILKNEKHKREYYTGFLGKLNIDNTTSLYVNLRCMQLLKDNAYLYLGNGIVEDSIPEKEWNETESKADILLSVLKSKVNT